VHSRSRHRSRWAHANTPEAKRRKRAKADAQREQLSAALPPVDAGPQPLSHWQTVVVQLYVPIRGRCDQHAAVIDGKRVGLVSATQIGVLVRKAIADRPSAAMLAEMRRDQGYTERDDADCAALRL
jgi:hypothetical protein